jgi:hypothetical protein
LETPRPTTLERPMKWATEKPTERESAMLRGRSTAMATPMQRPRVTPTESGLVALDGEEATMSCLHLFFLLAPTTKGW